MPTIGSVNEISEGFLWTIGYFFTLTEGEFYNSPEFLFGDHRWYLTIQRDNRSRCITVWLGKKSPHRSIVTDCSISLKTLDDKKDKEYYRYDIKGVRIESGRYRIISLSQTFVRESEQVPSDVFTVLCTFKHPNSIEDKSGIAAAQCPYCEEALDSESLSSHENKCLNKPIKCPECCDVISLKDWYEHECQVTGPKGDVSLTQDYKKVLLEGRKHDLILKIGNKQLRAHQDILRARSRVFQSMLDHDMKEKNSGVIDVPDCDPQAMELFLSYVYCGKVEDLDQSNMLGLYYISDKYDMQGLKDDCCKFIKTSLSTTNICDVIQLAMNHSDSDLLDYATEYFMNNALDILRTVEWQSFLKDNSTVGNELLIKSFEKLKT